MQQLALRKSISYEAAAEMVAVAVDTARQEGIEVSVAVIDCGGGLKAFASMDGAVALSLDACRAKAYTALIGMGSGEVGDALESSLPQLVSFASFDNVTLLGGGVPIIIAGEIVGAIGVGGGETQQDIYCAQAALDILLD